jgi:hypothetical protein
MNEIILKWGTLKGWSFASDRSKAWKLIKKYAEKMPISCACHKPTLKERKLLCEAIDAHNGIIWNDWDDVKMTKREAKKYIMEYGNA